MNNYRIENDEVVFDCGCVFDIVNGELQFSADTHSSLCSIDFQCPATYKLISDGFTEGVFQLNSALGRQWSGKVAPTELEHIAALGSILRPGCMNSKDEEGLNTTIHYERRKNHKEEIKPYHPVIDNILKDSFGLMIYQENLISIAKECAGFSLEESDSLRKSVGKKDTILMAKVEKLFIDKCKETKILTDEQSQYIFNQIKTSQRYLFNHCLTYDTIVECEDGFKTILELQIGDKVKCPTGKYVKIKNTFDNGSQEVYEITLESGKKIICTINHKFLCENGKIKPLLDILVNSDKIICEEE